MEAFSTEKWTVLKLKGFLKSRGIPCSGYNRPQLLKIVKNAQDHPELVEEVQPSDGEAIHEERRTVMVSGQKIVLPQPSCLTGWEENLRTIPYITHAHCMMYLMVKKGWSTNRITVGHWLGRDIIVSFYYTFFLYRC